MAQLVTKKTVTAIWNPVTTDSGGATLTTAPKYNVYLAGQPGDSHYGAGIIGDSYSVTFPTSGNYTVKVTAYLLAPDGITQIESVPNALAVTVFLGNAPASPTGLKLA
jgi:hypothetical protein